MVGKAISTMTYSFEKSSTMHDVAEKYVAAVGDLHRKKFGQFFTEQRIARFMADWVLSGNSSISLFDPAFGLGAFYDAAHSAGFRGAYIGVEIDPKVMEFFCASRNSVTCQIANADYLAIWGNSYPAIVCNPPYMRFQKIVGRDAVHANFEKHLGIRLSGYTNIASAFLVKSISELSEGGRLAYIMPLEFLNAGYGNLVKKMLLEQGTLHAIIRIACEKEAFPEATTSVGVILFEKKKAEFPIRFFVAETLAHLEVLLDANPVSSMSIDSLSPDEKWFRHFEYSSQIPIASQLIPIKVYGGFSRGIATGANEFFTLNKVQFDTLGLRNAEIAPCITKSLQIKKSIFRDVDLSGLVDANAPVCLLNLNGNLSDGARKYLEHGERLGFHNRYLTKSRSPWYKIENRKPAPLLFGVFSRGGFKIIRNYTDALNLTCYHGFQPNLFGFDYIDHLFLYFQSVAGRHILSLNMRRYGDALDKFEPNDLNNALCPSMDFFKRIGKNEICTEITYLEKYGNLSSRAELMFAGLLSQKLLPLEAVRHAA